VLLRIVIAALRFIAGWSERKELKQTDVQSVLIVELSRLGDVVSMVPVVVALKARFSGAAIHLLVDSRYHSLLNGLDLGVQVDAIPSSESFSGMIQALRVSRTIKAGLAISMSPAKRNAIVTLASGLRFRIGYLSYTNTLTPFLLRLSVESFGIEPPEQLVYARENIEERSWKVFRALGFAPRGDSRAIRLKQEICEPLRVEMKKRGTLPGRPYVMIHPFSGWKYRNWDLGRFNALADRITQAIEHDVVFLYSHDDEEKIKPSREKFKGRSEIHFFPSGDLLHSAVLMNGAALFIGNDSGPLHLASLLGVQVVGLFGPAAPELTAPRAAKGALLYERVECSPCKQRICIRPDNPCMELISVDAVHSVVMSTLSSAARTTVAHA
jgi:ADP-heptose:LPS heptosyltransferase